MSLEVAALIEAARADRTLVRGLLHVQDLVNGQGAALAKTLAAFVAFEGLLLTVDVPVISEMILSPKGLAANVAGIRPLVGMGSLVDEKIIGFRELSITEFTNKLLLRSGRSTGCSE